MIRKKRMSKGIAKILSGLLVFGMVAGLVPAVPGGTVHAKAEGESEQNVTAAENPEHKHCVCGKGEHPNNGHDYKEETWTGIKNDEQLKNITADGHYYLENDVTIDSAWICPNGVTLCLNGHNITREGNADQNRYGWNAVIKINSGTTFTLTDCQETVGTITHKAGVSGEGVYNAGKFTMYNGKLSGNNGGGVDNDKGTFTMSGGTITLNTAYNGGGVDNDKGVFSMYGGTISGNAADYGGGVYNGSGSTFSMSGGEISKNTTTNYGGGVFNKGGTFIMSDVAKISENKAMYGGGVYNGSYIFNMSGGEITNNESTSYGGGVYNNIGTFNMSGGKITNNTTTIAGGGVYNNNGTFNMNPGTTISDNKAYCGGGVFNDSKTFVMSGGTITKNKAVGSDLNPNPLGGGVFNFCGKFEMSGGTITSNKSGQNGGGVYNESPSSFIISGTVEITENKVGEINNNLYLLNGQKVSASGLTGGAVIGVTTYISPTENSPVTITSDTAEAEYFVSDNSDYEIGTGADGNVVLKKKPAVEAPTIKDQPQSVSVKSGEMATFTVVAAGADLSYQWRVDKKDIQGFVDIAGATSESYTLNAISKEYNGYRYQCMVSNRGGHVMSDCVTLTVTEDATPTPTPNPTPEATTPTPDPAPATSTPAASTTVTPAASAPAQVTYDILDGAGSSWTQNTDGSLAIRGSGEISKFREVKVDGVTVDPVNYTVTEGSTIITFKPEYLKSLSAGNHSFELVWTDGTAATNFTVAENADQSAKSPKTGEDFSMALCTALLMVSCAGLAGMFAKRKRNHAR